MAWTSFQLYLALGMVITGSINTISTKWADELESEGRDGEKRAFDHPFLQASCMFFGEFLCFIAYKVLYFYYKRKGDGSENVHTLTKGNTNFNPFILFIPAMCDLMGTSIMYMGLNLTYASSFQMFRGSVIVFVALLSVGFLDRVLGKKQIYGIVYIIIGLAIVGGADFMSNNPTESHGRIDIITGDMLICIAQVITAIQMVVEEKFVNGLNINPLQVVGWEGLFGFTVLSLLQIPFYYIHIGRPFSTSPEGRLEDVIDGLVQIMNNWRLVVAIIGTILSIAFFNFFGISVTKELSATTRMVLDSVRTIFIWAFSLAFFGQEFNWLQLIGFCGLLLGMCVYNGLTCGGVFVKVRSMCGGRAYVRVVDEEIIENHTADQPDSSIQA